MLFPEYGVYFIAVNDGVDSIHGDSEFTVIRNVFNQMYAKDQQKDQNHMAVQGALRGTSRHDPALWVHQSPGG